MEWPRLWPVRTPAPAAAAAPALPPPPEPVPVPDVVTPSALEEAVADAAAVLSPDEVYALLAAATQDRQQELWDEQARALAAKQAADARAARVADPLAYVGLASGDNAITYVKLKQPLFQHERTVRLQGVTYEHVSEDDDGIWIYRHLG